jgi:hypothetical protein
MADYESHAQASREALGSLKNKWPTDDQKLRVAQVEALLAIAAAIAGPRTDTGLR